MTGPKMQAPKRNVERTTRKTVLALALVAAFLIPVTPVPTASAEGPPATTTPVELSLEEYAIAPGPVLKVLATASGDATGVALELAIRDSEDSVFHRMVKHIDVSAEEPTLVDFDFPDLYVGSFRASLFLDSENQHDEENEADNALQLELDLQRDLLGDDLDYIHLTGPDGEIDGLSPTWRDNRTIQIAWAPELEGGHVDIEHLWLTSRLGAFTVEAPATHVESLHGDLVRIELGNGTANPLVVRARTLVEEIRDSVAETNVTEPQQLIEDISFSMVHPVSAGGSGTILFSDDFNDNVLDSSKWTVVNAGSGITETGGQLRMTVTELATTQAILRSSTFSASFGSGQGVEVETDVARAVSGTGWVAEPHVRLVRSDTGAWIDLYYSPWVQEVRVKDSSGANNLVLSKSRDTALHHFHIIATGTSYTVHYDSTSVGFSSSLFNGATTAYLEYEDQTGGSTSAAWETSARDNAEVRRYGSPASGSYDGFNDGSIDTSKWTTSNAAENGDCGYRSNARALKFSGTGTRQAATTTLNVAGGGTLSFYLKFGATTASACENADAGEDIVLEYSINAGSTWTNIATYDTEAYTTFTYVSTSIPLGAQTAATQFRWRQLTHSGSTFDAWAIDDVSIPITSGDAYEPDNTFVQYTSITPTTTVQSQAHTIDPIGDEDYLRFYGYSTRQYHFYTEGSTDTFGHLYNSGQTQVAMDDDSGSGLNFDITYQPTSSGYHYLKVRGYSPTSTTGPYTLYYHYTLPNQDPNACINTPTINGMQVSVSSCSSDPDGDPLSYDWNWGDGSAHATTSSASHTYACPANTWTLTLSVNDGNGGSDTATRSATTQNNDGDGDGLLYCTEIALGTDPNDWDTDNDGLSDGFEQNDYGTNPLDSDHDNDGALDGVDRDPFVDLSVTVQIQEYNVLDPVDVGSAADVYFKVKAGGSTWTSITRDNDDRHEPNFVPSINLADDTNNHAVEIEMWDEDLSSDDELDISGTGSSCDLTYSLSTGQWWNEDSAGDADGYNHCSGNADGSTGSDQDDAEVWFFLYQNDQDGDHLPFLYERSAATLSPTVYEFNDDDDGDGLRNWQEHRYGRNLFDNDEFGIDYVVSLNWNAPASYISDLEQGFADASTYLWDATDGHIMFGRVRIYESSVNWATADIRIEQGDADDPSDPNWPHVPGTGAHIVMPETFDGDGPTASDWFRTVVHEMGHYEFNMLDEYFGHNPLTGGFYPDTANWDTMHYHDDCPPSIMEYQYDRSEFEVDNDRVGPALGVADDCETTHHWEHRGDHSTWHSLFLEYNARVDFDLDRNGVADASYPAGHSTIEGPHERVGDVLRYS